MDDRQGIFKPLTDEEAMREEGGENIGRIFRVGEIIKIKDSTFRVKSIKPCELRLKLLSDKQAALVKA